MMQPYRREVWSGKAVWAVQVECGLCTKVIEPIHSDMKWDMNRNGWQWSGKHGWLCPDCWPDRMRRVVIAPNP